MSMSSRDDDREVCQLIVAQAPDAVIYADRQGIIRVWNDAATDLFGYRQDEAVGQSLDIIIPDHLRRAHWNGFDAALAAGHTKHGRRALKTRATHQTGDKLYVSLAFAVVKDRDEKVIGALATARAFVDQP